MDFEGRYAKLNDAQKQAVDNIDGTVMVIAGPGTGKTELLSMRAANILKLTDTLPENILCLTFTDSGANAMRERLAQTIGPQAYKVAIHTFHSFGTEIINHHGKFFYHGANFRPANELSSYEIIRKIFDELSYDSPLASKMNGEYTHLGDTLKAISELKKSGLTSDELISVLEQNLVAIDLAEPLLREAFESRISKNTATKLIPIIEKLRACNDIPPVATVVPLSRVMRESLETAINNFEVSNSTKPITTWKNEWIKKDDRGEFILKSRERATKLYALSFIYSQYLARMQEAELFDFDDMILNVIHAMETQPDLRFNLQEKYLYIMVDEFQDTNMAQMRILLDLMQTPTGDEPNIMVVGDDDQAIYSFQGAEVGNIINFRGLYENTKQITLIDNYRSSPSILEHARKVIVQGEDRLENRIEGLNKTLVPHVSPEKTSTKLVEHAVLSDEWNWLTSDINQRIKSGEQPSEIAVLARRHREIVDMLPYFVEAGISVNYERRDNVLEMEIIRHLELLGNILTCLFQKRHNDADAILPELMAHPAWAIDPIDVWKLSIKARQNHKNWMEIMSVTPEFLSLHKWLVQSSQKVEFLPLEQMLDHMIGHNVPESEEFVSPIYRYFFAPEKLKEQPDEYLSYLEALRTIRSKLTEYRPNEAPRLATFLEFIHLHRALGSTIESVRPHVASLTGAIQLMTAHKSKGLEFDRVYVIGAIDSMWGERVRSRNSLISYPENLQLAPSGNTPDERLKLFYVAMTRAKKHLSISYSLSDNNGKQTLPASFLAMDGWEKEMPKTTHTIETLTRAAELMWYKPYVDLHTGTMQELLAPMIEKYRISATDVCTFLDITHGGPQGFLINRLLRFPKATSPSAAYGTAIHKTLQRAHAHLSATGEQRPPEDILHDYEQLLSDQYLADDDYQTFLEKGCDSLQAFLKRKYDSFSANQKSELSFAGQHSMIGDVHLTGSVDLIDQDAKKIIVTDYKTGRPARDWKGKSEMEKIKLHHYRQQLMFYKLLIENARDYSGYTVQSGVLQFVEPTKSGEIISLDIEFDREEVERFTELIKKVWQHIKALDLPDTSHYEPTYKGLLAFEDDLMG